MLTSTLLSQEHVLSAVSVFHDITNGLYCLLTWIYHYDIRNVIFDHRENDFVNHHTTGGHLLRSRKRYSHRCCAASGGGARRQGQDILGTYWDEHDEINDGPDARAPGLFMIENESRRRDSRIWLVRQIIDDPAGNHDWSITATVDLDECDEADDLVLRTRAFARLD